MTSLLTHPMSTQIPTLLGFISQGRTFSLCVRKARGITNTFIESLTHWLPAWLAGLPVWAGLAWISCFGRVPGQLAGWQAGWLTGWLDGWLAVRLSVSLYVCPCQLAGRLAG